MSETNERTRYAQVVEPMEIADWTLQFMGAAWMACHGEQGSAGRNQRAQWTGRQLVALGRAVRALAVVAFKHPDEFREALGKPIEIELLEWLRCESRTLHFGLEVQCELQRHEEGDHVNDQLRWKTAAAVKR